MNNPHCLQIPSCTRRAAEERMARDIDQFYGDVPPALPVGVVGAEADDDVEGPSGEVTPANAAR